MRMYDPPHSGELVREECLAPLGLTITAGARALGVTRKALSELVDGHSGISPEMAIRLSKAFGSEPETWLGMQMEYDLWHAMRQASRLRVKRLSARPVAENRPLGKALRSGSLFGAHPGSVRIKRGVDLVTANPVLDE